MYKLNVLEEFWLDQRAPEECDSWNTGGKIFGFRKTTSTFQEHKHTLTNKINTFKHPLNCWQTGAYSNGVVLKEFVSHQQDNP